MTKAEAQTSIKEGNKQLFSLTPSALVTLFEIDASDLAFNSGMISEASLQAGDLIFRFHNNIKLGTTSIFWQGQEYIAAPIFAEGFEVSAKGTSPTPTLSITSNADGIDALAVLKIKIRQLDDLVGAKVTRIRTFAKYLDAKNFTTELPKDFTPGPTELPRDIYYIDSKSQEDKFSISFLLSSIFDVQGLALPQEIVISNRCRFQYRGCGCLYEYKANRVDAIHGSIYDSVMPESAPPVANVHDELIIDTLQIPSVTVKGKWQLGAIYAKGEAIFVEKHGIKYYFVSKEDSNTSSPPGSKWIEDACSLSTNGCKLRWKDINLGFTDNNGNPVFGVLPYGGFPGVNKSQ